MRGLDHLHAPQHYSDNQWYKTSTNTRTKKSIFSSFQLVPYRPTDDEVVHTKRLGNKALVVLYRSNPLIVNWDELGQKFKHFLKRVCGHEMTGDKRAKRNFVF